MIFKSTRGQAPELGFDDVLLTGLAQDGGLYVPDAWPKRSADDWRALRGAGYADLAAAITRPFIAGSVLEAGYDDLMEAAYSTFDHPAVAPMVQLDTNT